MSNAIDNISRVLLFSVEEIEILRELLNEELDVLEHLIDEAQKHKTDLPQLQNVDRILTNILRKIEHAG